MEDTATDEANLDLIWDTVSSATGGYDADSRLMQQLAELWRKQQKIHSLMTPSQPPVQGQLECHRRETQSEGEVKRGATKKLKNRRASPVNSVRTVNMKRG